MDIADTCRVCLCGQRRLHPISNTLFQEMWEKLTNAKFNANDGKSLLVCYLCCAQLRRSHQLMKRALEADKLLTDIVNSSSEQSQNALLLLASQSFAFEYTYTIEHLYPLEYKQFVRSTVEEIKKENEEDNEEFSVIYMKEEERDSNEEDNLDNTNAVSSPPLDDKTDLKDILESEVHIVVEGIDIGAAGNEMDTFKNDIKDMIQELICAQNSRMDKLESHIMAIKNQNVKIENTNHEIEKSMTFVSEQLTSLETKISGLEKDRVSLAKNVAVIQERVETFDHNLIKTSTEIRNVAKKNKRIKEHAIRHDFKFI
ncbi:hypothetical protein K1T71_000713 [Dendrolimus kikuchii]|uniref:Uncharacterized protein n=1 Tax=Dendrolimus kikuchii TaxID=765133 RepID=A0ACC1DK56_9NEOP|nr:hypothetical protein K1T71_000713 [Dendrolimus kikuchii]